MRINELNEKHVKEFGDLTGAALDVGGELIGKGFKWVYDKVTGKKKKVRTK